MSAMTDEEMKRQKHYEEYNEFDFSYFKRKIPPEEEIPLLLFNINNNLKRIADSLDAIFLKM